PSSFPESSTRPSVPSDQPLVRPPGFPCKFRVSRQRAPGTRARCCSEARATAPRRWTVKGGRSGASCYGRE
ncbi:hypothetical protein GT037_000928, partial [Alternaria burnsii]